jgi:hypothetical protein
MKDKIATEKWERYKLLGTNKIQLELLQARGKTCYETTALFILFGMRKN